MLRIVLVEPKHGGNVGAAARAMANFGFSDLAIAGEPPSFEGEAEWWATSGSDVLDNRTESSSLQSAISDCVVTIGTTSERGRTGSAHLTPEGVASRLNELEDGETLALVFGRERSGLTREEIDLCGLTASIPTVDETPTMNLAQAVSIFCYAARVSTLNDDGSAKGDVDRTEPLADAAAVERLHQMALEILEKSGFLNPQNREGTYAEMRHLVARAGVTEREVTILLGMLRQLEWWGQEK